MSIEIAVAGALRASDTVLLPWPDWGWRRFLLLEVGKRKDVVFLLVRPCEGDDELITHSVYRAAYEPVHLVRRGAAQSWLDSGSRPPATCVKCGQQFRRHPDLVGEEFCEMCQ